MSVDIAANAVGAGAMVDNASGTIYGKYYVASHSALINEAITAAHATLPRIDQVILEVQDTTIDGSGANAARVRVVDGTATAAATLDNRNGAATLPLGSIRLADVLVAATDTAITNTEIRDRRPWALGAFCNIVTSGNLTRSASTFAELDSTNLKPRVEFSSGAYRAVLQCEVQSATLDKFARFDLFVDGVALGRTMDIPCGVAAADTHVSLAWYLDATDIAAGSHRIAPAWASKDNVTLMTIPNRARILTFTVEEIGRTSYDQNSLTTG
jgi:hypothetical protein